MLVLGISLVVRIGLVVVTKFDTLFDAMLDCLFHDLLLQRLADALNVCRRKSRTNLS